MNKGWTVITGRGRGSKNQREMFQELHAKAAVEEEWHEGKEARRFANITWPEMCTLAMQRKCPKWGVPKQLHTCAPLVLRMSHQDSSQRCKDLGATNLTVKP